MTVNVSFIVKCLSVFGCLIIVLVHLKKLFILQNVSISSVLMFVSAIITNDKHEICNSSESFCPTILLHYIYHGISISEWITVENILFFFLVG